MIWPTRAGGKSFLGGTLYLNNFRIVQFCRDAFHEQNVPSFLVFNMGEKKLQFWFFRRSRPKNPSKNPHDAPCFWQASDRWPWVRGWYGTVRGGEVPGRLETPHGLPLRFVRSGVYSNFINCWKNMEPKRTYIFQISRFEFHDGFARCIHPSGCLRKLKTGYRRLVSKLQSQYNISH